MDDKFYKVLITTYSSTANGGGITSNIVNLHKRKFEDLDNRIKMSNVEKRNSEVKYELLILEVL